MSELFDDISRIVGSQISRRQALKLVGAALASAALAPVGFGRSVITSARSAQDPLGRCYTSATCLGLKSGQYTFMECCNLDGSDGCSWCPETLLQPPPLNELCLS